MMSGVWRTEERDGGLAELVRAIAGDRAGTLVKDSFSLAEDSARQTRMLRMGDA